MELKDNTGSSNSLNTNAPKNVLSRGGRVISNVGGKVKNSISNKIMKGKFIKPSKTKMVKIAFPFLIPIIVLVVFALIVCVIESDEQNGACSVSVSTLDSVGDASENEEKFSDPAYVHNAFVKIAATRGWNSNAIIGTLSYIMQEGSGYGSFTYESYWASPGPSGKAKDKTLDNQKWLKWLANSTTQNWYYASYREQEARGGGARADWAIGLGLMQWSDVSSGTRNATNLIKAADEKGVYWQDLGFQLNYLIDQIENSNDVDLKDVDPTSSNKSADEWCRRVTAGIGMPGWSHTDNSQGMLNHTRHVSRAREVLENSEDVDVSSLNRSGCAKTSKIYMNGEGAIAFEKYADASGKITSKAESKAIWQQIGKTRDEIGGFGADRYQCTEFVAYCFYMTYGKNWLKGNGQDMVANLLAEHGDQFYNTQGKPVAGGVISIRPNHVAFIHEVKSNGKVVISDGNVYLGISRDTGGKEYRTAGTPETGIRIMMEVDWDTYKSQYDSVVVAGPKK